MGISRRGFLQAGGMTGVALLLTGGLSRTAFGQVGVDHDGASGLAALSQKHFDDNIYSLFSFYVEKYDWLEFQLVEVLNLASPAYQTNRYDGGDDVRVDDSPGSPRKECFSLVFQSLRDLPLSQGTYRLKHETLGEFELFVVPLKAGSMRYVAVINRAS